jgi:deoxyribonuclease V
MWPTTREELISVQTELGDLRPEPWNPPEPIRLIGGCFICYPRGHVGKRVDGDRYWAAAVCLEDNEVAAVEVVVGETAAPYEPGLLALREGPLLETAILRLSIKPELMIINATGRDHPRRAGLAVHLGWRLSIPSIGVTRNPLIAAGDWPADPIAGAKTPLKIGEEVVGYWMRMKTGRTPLAVHAGWRTTPETAAHIMEGMIKRWKTPEPLRQARRAAREARAQMQKSEFGSQNSE